MVLCLARASGLNPSNRKLTEKQPAKKNRSLIDHTYIHIYIHTNIHKYLLGHGRFGLPRVASIKGTIPSIVNSI